MRPGQNQTAFMGAPGELQSRIDKGETFDVLGMPFPMLDVDIRSIGPHTVAIEGPHVDNRGRSLMVSLCVHQPGIALRALASLAGKQPQESISLETFVTRQTPDVDISTS